MKFIKLLSKIFLATIVILTIIHSLLVEVVECKKEKNLESKNNLEISESTERNKGKTKSKIKNNPPISSKTNTTISNTLNTLINKTINDMDLKTFKQLNSAGKFHQLFDKQLEELFLLFRNHKMAGVADFRSAYNLFVLYFDKCDKDKDFLLSSQEFIDCMKNDPFLNLIQAPDRLYTTNSEFILNATSFASNLFIYADNFDKNGLNLYDYVVMRLMAFAWRKCSVNSPFIDEASFECAVNIISGSKSMHSNTLRKLYHLALELGNTKSQSVRTMDFILYYALASSIRLYGNINAKEDMDATYNEFNTALDINILPTRYTQQVINDLFKLIKSPSSSKNGIDLFSFCFYDHFLKMFYQGFKSEKRWKLSLNEFNQLANNYIFPEFIINYLRQVPQANFTVDSFNLRAHINPSLLSEGESMGKFLEITNFVSSGRHNNTSYYQPLALKRIFSLLDSNNEGYLSFYDFGVFIQTFYLYNNVDIKHADRVLAGTLFTRFSEYSELPVYSELFKEKSKRFSILDQDVYIDPYYALAIIRMDDYVSHYLRKSDPTSVKEIELNLILEKINLKNFPLHFLSKCSRGKDENEIPKFDWECSLTKAITKTLYHLEHTRDLSDIKDHDLKLTFTVIDTAGPN